VGGNAGNLRRWGALKERRRGIKMEHNGHFMKVCSNCGNVVAQCRCMGPKEIIHVDRCDKCNRSAADPAPQQSVIADRPAHGTESRNKYSEALLVYKEYINDKTNYGAGITFGQFCLERESGRFGT
jgi:hypothetical protein